MNNLTPKQFKEEMERLEREYSDDPECRHGAGDDLMCNLLRSLGYGEGIEIYDNWTKWYA